MLKLLMPFAFFSALTAQAQIYETTDADGKKRFSDTASEDSQSINLPQTNTAKSIDVPSPQPSTSDPIQAEPLTVKITSPSDGQSIGPKTNHLVFEWTSNVDAKLISRVQLWMDHEVVGDFAYGSQVGLALRLPHRGEHSFHIHLLDKDRRTIAQSPNVRLHIIRPSGSGLRPVQLPQ
ncbi:DUF4124 domain-containing protein [Agaribacterium haliotis]|uniref:DUF4124 domain-containing protein n=1 Tax=Agaribacterium haliotis TaxID=2013869 RepID=UPI000BB58F31|nr:DUF4124 domain-containing protein [Agaribacterium haliotis]